MIPDGWLAASKNALIRWLQLKRQGTGEMDYPILLPTSLVGSYPQPEWLINRPALVGSVARTSAPHLWLIDEKHRHEAKRDAVRLAVLEQERAGLDIITDGEQSRESYTNEFATALEGIDRDRAGETLHHTGRRMAVPRVVGALRLLSSVGADSIRLVRAQTTKMVKATVPGPFTLSLQAQDDYYRDAEALAFAYASAVNAEVRALFAAGADIVQLDEPWMVSVSEKARNYGVKLLNHALEGVNGTTAVHICLGYAHVSKNKPNRYAFLSELAASVVREVSIESAQAKVDLTILRELASKTIILGVLDLGDENIETPELVAERVRAGLKHVDPTRLVIAPDCGMKYMPRHIAFGKLRAMVIGTEIVRRELTGFRN
jgi:5-methyltetrahydropteroyltriglutamate--homocysteine methyltransferase